MPNNFNPSTVAIVGAGPSGLAAAKYAREFGLSPVVFEKGSAVGGLWKGGTGIWSTMHSNISHYSCCFSDWPFKRATLSSEMFPTAPEVHHYLNTYVVEFQLGEFIKLNAEVTSISALSGGWQITWTEQGSSKNKAFDFVIICCGIFASPFVPSEFRGENVIHSSQFECPGRYQNKDVLVVGNAFSGAEISRAISDVASSVVNSVGTRCPYVIPRLVQHSKTPQDLHFYNRPIDAEPTQQLSEKEAWKKRHEMFQKYPNQSVPAQVIICDGYYEKILAPTPKISIKPRTVSVVGDSQSGRVKVKFADSTEWECDTVICATGFELVLPFMDEKTKNILKYDPRDKFQPILTHETMLHPDLPNMALVGVYRGPFFAAIELQARWVCSIFSGILDPPSFDEMRSGLEKEKKIREHTPRPQFPHPDYVATVDGLASALKIHPGEKLAELNLQYTPVIPAQFQLTSKSNKVAADAKKIVEEVNTYLINLESVGASSFEPATVE
eukprot:TRINITY_DN227_c0_g1_i1.p1 TRINITY_DN227_c0_g1~~TRINITY_DN227_c0_g1_i1.p1  ORF type:complete len:498 (+),score=64.12 TRINITY_DN227_c0_g1_i1:27-1520(+)